MTLVRILMPLAGSPRVRIRLRPLGDYGAVHPTLTYGSNHIRYVLPDLVMRLTTDASITAVLEERTFVLDHPVALVLGPDETLPDAPAAVARHFLGETKKQLGIVDAWPLHSVRVAGRRHSRGDYSQALHLRGYGRRDRGRHELDPGSSEQRP